MDLYLVRHGETLANEQQLYCGKTDLALTEKGMRQAQTVSHCLRNIPFDHVITSSLQRTQQTASAINATAQISDPALNEIDFGEWEMRSYREIQQSDPQGFQYWCDHWQTAAPPNGESFTVFQQRVQSGIAHIPQSATNVLLVGHQGMLRILLCELLRLDSASFWQFHFQQGKYSRIHWHAGTAVIDVINSTEIL